MRNKLLLWLLILSTSLSACCGPKLATQELSLPPVPIQAGLTGPKPKQIKIQTQDGRLLDIMAVEPSDFRELLRELRQLRAWRDAVRLLHQKPLAGPPDAPNADQDL